MNIDSLINECKKEEEVNMQATKEWLDLITKNKKQYEDYTSHISYNKLLGDDYNLKIFIGFNEDIFLTIHNNIQDLLYHHKDKGRHSTFSTEDKLLFFLHYLKFYPTFQRIGADFGISATYAKDLLSSLISTLSPRLKQAYIYWIPRDEQKVSFKEFPEVGALVDTTPIQIWTPSTMHEKEKYYCAKYKIHCLKYQVLFIINLKILN
jgi:hypothetical protein